MSIPDLLQTLSREQDRQQLNVDLSFVGGGARGLVDIEQRARTQRGDDPAESARDDARRAWFDGAEPRCAATQTDGGADAPTRAPAE